MLLYPHNINGLYQRFGFRIYKLNELLRDNKEPIDIVYYILAVQSRPIESLMKLGMTVMANDILNGVFSIPFYRKAKTLWGKFGIKKHHFQFIKENDLGSDALNLLRHGIPMSNEDLAWLLDNDMSINDASAYKYLTQYMTFYKV